MVFNEVNVLFMHGSEARFSTFLFETTVQVTSMRLERISMLKTHTEWNGKNSYCYNLMQLKNAK